MIIKIIIIVQHT